MHMFAAIHGCEFTLITQYKLNRQHCGGLSPLSTQQAPLREITKLHIPYLAILASQGATNSRGSSLDWKPRPCITVYIRDSAQEHPATGASLRELRQSAN